MALNFRLRDIGRQTTQLESFETGVLKSITLWRELKRDVRGATAIEYGLLAGLVAVGLAGGLGALSDLVNLLFEIISDETADVASSITDP